MSTDRADPRIDAKQLLTCVMRHLHRQCHQHLSMHTHPHVLAADA